MLFDTVLMPQEICVICLHIDSKFANRSNKIYDFYRFQETFNLSSRYPQYILDMRIRCQSLAIYFRNTLYICASCSQQNLYNEHNGIVYGTLWVITPPVSKLHSSLLRPSTPATPRTHNSTFYTVWRYSSFFLPRLIMFHYHLFIFSTFSWILKERYIYFLNSYINYSAPGSYDFAFHFVLFCTFNYFLTFQEDIIYMFLNLTCFRNSSILKVTISISLSMIVFF